jgi:PKD repeat protein
VGFFPGAYYRAQSINFTEDLSTVPNAPPEKSLTLRWDFGDGSPHTSGPAPKHIYQHAGTFAIRVSIYDSVSKSWADFDSASITLLDQPYSSPPIAKAVANKTLVAINDTVTFDATGSKALVGSIQSYDWNFGDATPDGLGQHVTHAFTIPGRALVTLIVTDGRGAFSTTVIPITVVVSIPQVHLQVSATTALPGQTITFDASQVQLSGGDQISKYIWDFGDQTPTQTTAASTITHSYAKPGRYTMTVQAIDAQNVPGTATAEITIQSSQNAAGGISSITLIRIGLGALIVLVIGALVIVGMRRRQPAPAPQGYRTAGRGAPQRPGAPARRPSSSQQTRPGQPPTRQSPTKQPPRRDW